MPCGLDGSLNLTCGLNIGESTIEWLKFATSSALLLRHTSIDFMVLHFLGFVEDHQCIKMFIVVINSCRKQVDPETAKYFSEIANLFEGTAVDFDDRSVICGNALEETMGKELELATDYFISPTLQTLLEGCDIDHLCGFLQSCAKEFSHIAMDKSGSHVVETALRSLAVHIQDEGAYSVIGSTLNKICQVTSICCS